MGSKKRRDVERDITPAFNLTYLELFFFESRLREQKKAENLTNDEAFKIADAVQKDPDLGLFYQRPPVLTGPVSDYAFLWFKRLTAQREWQDFLARNRPGDPDFAAKKEALLQDHARRFFEGKISYQP